MANEAHFNSICFLGASLANIAFSRPGTTVIEMGFESLPQASHYRHLSSALGLNHVDVWLERDAR
jgi:hypothetical protein